MWICFLGLKILNLVPHDSSLKETINWLMQLFVKLKFKLLNSLLSFNSNINVGLLTFCKTKFLITIPLQCLFYALV